jgi:hypothetical protein
MERQTVMPPRVRLRGREAACLGSRGAVMKAMLAAALLGAFCIDAGSALLAQGADDVPVQRDLRRERRLERRLQDSQPPAFDPNVTPDNPDGVVGFDGPPGLIDDDVEESGPMAPGSPADIDDD